MKKKTQINIFSENIHELIEVDEKKAINIAKKLLGHFLATENIVKKSCLNFEETKRLKGKGKQGTEAKSKKQKAKCVESTFGLLPLAFCSEDPVHSSLDCISFDILYCDNKKTHEINKEYRQKDSAADIITFAIFADSEEKFIFDGEINLGEIIISLDKVGENAKEKNIKDTEELYFLISHGIMHLLGFDHQTIEEYNFIVEAQNVALSKIKE